MIMTSKEVVIQELEKIPQHLLDEVLDFIQFLIAKYSTEELETHLLSESVLAKDWLSVEEDRAWQDLVKGDVVIVPFPFSDLTQSKRRPALVVASLTGDDVILCQITSQTVRDDYALTITGDDFTSGSLNQTSNVRPNRIFTADQNIILYSVGHLQAERLEQVITKMIEILRA